MSGGSMNYVYVHVDEAASMTSDRELSELLHDAAKVLHAEEWWYSADSSEAEYRAELAAFKSKWFAGDRCERLKSYVDDQLNRARRECYSLIGAKVVE